VTVKPNVVVAAGQMVWAAGKSVIWKPGAGMTETVPVTEPVWGQPAICFEDW
jgi:hypothetical protein